MAEHRGGSGNFAEDRDKASGKLDVKAVSTAVAILKTIRNVHLRPVKKAAKIVMVADANLTTPDY